MTNVITLVAVLLLGGTAALAKPKDPPCEAGRYLLDAPLVAGQAAPPTDTIEAGASRVAIGGACARLAPQRFRAAAGGTKIKAIWPSCTGLIGKVKLTGTIVDGCTLLRGKVKARRFQARVQARRSTCGDGRVDLAGGEDCDPPGAGCDARCRRLAPAAIGAAGGRVTSDDGLLTLTVPAGALPTDTTLTIRPLTAAEATALGGELGWDLGPDGTQFARPITAMLTLPEPPLADDGSLGSALGALFTVNAAGEAELPPEQWLALDGVANVTTLSVDLAHFTPLTFRPIDRAERKQAYTRVTIRPGTVLEPGDVFTPFVEFQLREEILNDQDVVYTDQTAPGDIVVYAGAAEVVLGTVGEGRTRAAADVLGYACGREGIGEYRARTQLRLVGGILGIGGGTTSLVTQLQTLIECRKPRRKTTTTSTSTTSTSTSSRTPTTTSATSSTATTVATSTTASSARTTTTTSTTRTTTSTTTSSTRQINCCDCPTPRGCASGPDVRPADCTDFGCVFVVNAVCTNSGNCAVPTTSSSSTTSTSSTSSSSTSSSSTSTSSTTSTTAPPVSAIPIDAPEALWVLGVQFFGAIGEERLAVLVAGGNGWAIVDGETGQPLVAGYISPVGPALFVAAPLLGVESVPPALQFAAEDLAADEPALQGVIQAGLSGPAITLYDTEADDFGFTQVFPGNPPCLDAVPNGNDPLSGEMVLACGSRLQTLRPHDTFEYFESGPTHSGFTQATGPAFSAFRRRAGGPIVAVTHGTPGKVLKHPATGALGETPQEIGAAGNSPRRIRCAGTVCAVSNFASDSLTILTWDAQDVVSIVNTVTVGDGPVGIDIRTRTDGNFEVVSAGLNDDSYSVTVLRANGSTVSNQKRAVPAGCSKPGHVVWGSGQLVIMTCNGSDAIARVQAP